MKLSEAIKILKYANIWRRGDEDLEMPDPTELGIAIDVILDYLTKIKKDE
jgi:hypothetical protein